VSTPLQRKQTAAEAALQSVWRDWQRARRGVLDGRDACTAVHALRIATRRLLAVETLLCAPGIEGAGSVAARLEPVLHASGRLRDAQLSLGELDRLEPRFAVTGRIAKDLRRKLPVLSRRLEQRLGKLDRDALKKEVRGLLKPGGLELAGQTLRSERIRLRRDLSGNGVGPDPAALHKLRLRVKAVRYMSDWLAPLVPAARVPRGGLQLASVQRSLGNVADTRALLKTIDSWAGKSPRRQEQVATLRAHLQRLQSRRIAMHMSRIAGSCDDSA
jgi:CHAD domain-containing protein